MFDVVIPTRSLQRAEKAVEAVQPYAASVTLVMRPEWGFTAAVNEGWRGGSADYVLFLNDDCIVNEDALGKMVGLMQDPSVAIIGPTIPCADYQASKDNAPMEDGEHPVAMTVRHLIGACLLVRRSVLEELDGWDRDFVLHCSDLDLCIRAQDAGYKAVWAVQAEVEHESRATIKTMPADVRREMILRDHALFVRRHPDEKFTKHGVEVQMGVEDGYKVIYPKDIAMTAATTAA